MRQITIIYLLHTGHWAIAKPATHVALEERSGKFIFTSLQQQVRNVWERKLQVNSETLIPILIAAAVVIAASLIAWLAIRKWRSQKLRERFGPEYDYTMEIVGDRRAAEETLAEREKRINKVEIRTLNEDEKVRYQGEWIEIQANFVDNPSKSVEEANRLITEVMITRGFPVADFEQRAADLSVMYPDFVSNYRNAHDIAMKNQRNGTSTEELRQAMVYYRSLFEELLGAEEINDIDVEEKEAVTQ